MPKTTLSVSVDLKVLIALEESRNVDEYLFLSTYVEHIIKEYLKEKGVVVE
jgi:hypothetical protein